MPEGTWNPNSRTFDTSTSASTSQRGDEAGQDAKYEAIRRKGWEEEYAKSVGATGIAGASKRSKPEYKAGLKSFLEKKQLDSAIDRKRREQELANKVAPQE